ncbi:hypothetical protein BFL35_10135 [Clavibacter michiganensis]|nr:hypothetical protein BFL35_10135 [Clavibacter michiganensis]
MQHAEQVQRHGIRVERAHGREHERQGAEHADGHPDEREAAEQRQVRGRLLEHATAAEQDPDRGQRDERAHHHGRRDEQRGEGQGAAREVAEERAVAAEERAGSVVAREAVHARGGEEHDRGRPHQHAVAAVARAVQGGEREPEDPVRQQDVALEQQHHVQRPEHHEPHAPTQEQPAGARPVHARGGLPAEDHREAVREEHREEREGAVVDERAHERVGHAVERRAVRRAGERSRRPVGDEVDRVGERDAEQRDPAEQVGRRAPLGRGGRAGVADGRGGCGERGHGSSLPAREPARQRARERHPPIGRCRGSTARPFRSRAPPATLDP